MYNNQYVTSFELIDKVEPNDVIILQCPNNRTATAIQTRVTTVNDRLPANYAPGVRIHFCANDNAYVQSQTLRSLVSGDIVVTTLDDAGIESWFLSDWVSKSHSDINYKLIAVVENEQDRDSIDVEGRTRYFEGRFLGITTVQNIPPLPTPPILSSTFGRLNLLGETVGTPTFAFAASSPDPDYVVQSFDDLSNIDISSLTSGSAIQISLGETTDIGTFNPDAIAQIVASDATLYFRGVTAADFSVMSYVAAALPTAKVFVEGQAEFHVHWSKFRCVENQIISPVSAIGTTSPITFPIANLNLAGFGVAKVSHSVTRLFAIIG